MSESTQIVQNPGAEKLSAALIAKLRTVSILASLSEDELDCLQGVQELHLDEGVVIARQGEKAHHFWILLEGEVRVSQTLPNGGETTLHLMTQGTAFGELPLLANIPNAASLVATKPCHLMQLEEDGVGRMMTSCPEGRQAILGKISLTR